MRSLLNTDVPGLVVKIKLQRNREGERGRKGKKRYGLPNSHTPDIARSFLLQERANLLNLRSSAGSIEKKVAKLTAVRLDVNRPLCGSRIASQDQYLMLRPALFLDSVHDANQGEMEGPLLLVS